MDVSMQDRDAAAAFAITAILAGHLLADAVPLPMFEAVRNRLVTAGLADATASQPQLGEACDRLAGRIRMAAEGRS
jgi:hypothetical protein